VELIVTGTREAAVQGSGIHAFTPTMKILVITGMGPGIHAFGNMGDVAMLQSGLARLAHLWPSITLRVITERPEDLSRYCPDAVPIQAVGRNLWIGEDLLLGRFARYLPERVKSFAIKSKREAALRFPGTLKACLATRLRMQNRNAEIEAVSAFSETIAATDLVVACGAGGFFDGCREFNMQCLDTIEAAVHRDIPVAMFGQHFGPLSDPEILSRAKRILPAVNLITLRGNPAARTLLISLGVPISHIQVTGDEAIELAYEARPPESGTHLGVNFRLAGSAETNATELAMLRPILHQFAREHRVSLIPVPISLDAYTRDHLSLTQLLQGFDDQSDGGARLASPRQVIEQIGRCKVLVTGAYHAAVFALAQGIPVVALAKSSYFTEKFVGLENQFGFGCETLYFHQPHISENLGNAIARAWASADNLRIPLQQAALRQIQLTHSAYDCLKQIVTSRVKKNDARSPIFLKSPDPDRLRT
jgi:polysaccharide pyruvyl transferase WcaK-like protein